MTETTRIITIEITEVHHGKPVRTAETVKKDFELMFKDSDDVHVTVQDFEMKGRIFDADDEL